MSGATVDDYLSVCESESSWETSEAYTIKHGHRTHSLLYSFRSIFHRHNAHNEAVYKKATVLSGRMVGTSYFKQRTHVQYLTKPEPYRSVSGNRLSQNFVVLMVGRPLGLDPVTELSGSDRTITISGGDI